MNGKKISFIFVVIGFLMSLVAFQGNKWDRYYQSKLNQPPRPLIVEALTYFQTPGVAIDLGCGVGNETLLMLDKGWHVWAIDSQSNAIQFLNERKNLLYPKNLVTVVAKFDEGLNWEDLPQVNLFCASYALPFAKPDAFDQVWQNIMEKILLEGRFAGHFFGKNYVGFDDQEMKHMTFLTKEQVLRLFKDFDIEYFQEIEEDDVSGTGKKIHSHVFEIIARKRFNASH